MQKLATALIAPPPAPHLLGPPPPPVEYDSPAPSNMRTETLAACPYVIVNTRTETLAACPHVIVNVRTETLAACLHVIVNVRTETLAACPHVIVFRSSLGQHHPAVITVGLVITQNAIDNTTDRWHSKNTVLRGLKEACRYICCLFSPLFC